MHRQVNFFRLPLYPLKTVHALRWLESRDAFVPTRLNQHQHLSCHQRHCMMQGIFHLTVTPTRSTPYDIFNFATHGWSPRTLPESHHLLVLFPILIRWEPDHKRHPSRQGAVLASELGANDISRQTSALLKIASHWQLFFVLWCQCGGMGRCSLLRPTLDRSGTITSPTSLVKSLVVLARGCLFFRAPSSCRCFFPPVLRGRSCSIFQIPWIHVSPLVKIGLPQARDLSQCDKFILPRGGSYSVSHPAMPRTPVFCGLPFTSYIMEVLLPIDYFVAQCTLYPLPFCSTSLTARLPDGRLLQNSLPRPKGEVRVTTGSLFLVIFLPGFPTHCFPNSFVLR